MTTVDTSDPWAETAEDRARERARMRSSWTRGAQTGHATARRFQSVGDRLAQMTGRLYTVALPNPDPGAWWDRDRPDAGVCVDDILKHLRDAMAGVYALAGAYRRAAGQLEAALRDDAALGDLGDDPEFRAHCGHDGNVADCSYCAPDEEAR